MSKLTDEIYSLEGKKVFIAGHKGMLGSALVKRLANEKCSQILIVSKEELDLRDELATSKWMQHHRPDAIFLCAAKVGGILNNDLYPVDYLKDNLSIYLNVINAAHKANVEKLLFLGSSCIYPKFAKQPIDENELLTGALEPTNQWYAMAKIAGIKLCQAYRKQHKADFIVAMPTSLYGPGDNFNIKSAHVIAALMQRAHTAKIENANELSIWGTGTPRREFLHVDDCADALILLMKRYSDSLPINIGHGSDISISEVAQLIMGAVNYNGQLIFDTSKPDGTPRKLLSSQRIKSIGWFPKISFADGILETYDWFLKNKVMQPITQQ